MARKCTLSGSGNQFGHRVSHANNKTKHVFKSNLQTKKIFVPEENRYVRVRVSTRVIRTIDKLGLKATLAKYKVDLRDLLA
jgi:large subunit ribosomal protein L28